MGHFPIQSVRTDTFEMQYFQFGSGSRAFVIIPGISLKSVMESASAIADAFQTFTQEYTVYVFDRKQNLQAGYSIPDMAEDTSLAMMQLGIRNADIFGASQGGMIAQCIALEHPELVHKLFLGSTMARYNPTSHAVMSRWISLAEQGEIRALNHDIFTSIYSEAYYNRYKDIFQAMEGNGTPEEIRRLRALAMACLDFDIYDRLDQLRCPVFVAGSKMDRVLSGEASMEIAEKLRCPLYMYPDYSHSVYDEAPDYRQRMFAFLSSPD